MKKLKKKLFECKNARIYIYENNGNIEIYIKKVVELKKERGNK